MNTFEYLFQKATHYCDLAPLLFWLFDCVLVGCMYAFATRCLMITLLLSLYGMRGRRVLPRSRLEWQRKHDRDIVALAIDTFVPYWND